MQKSIKKLSILLLAATAAVCATAFTAVNIAKAEYKMSPDGNEKKEIFSDRFDGDGLKSEWKANGADIKLDGYALHFTKNSVWGNGLALNAVKMADYTRITYDMQVTDFNPNGDMSVCFGGRDIKDNVATYDFRLIIQNENVVCNKMYENSAGYYINGETYNPISMKVFSSGEKVSVELIHEATTSKKADFTVKMYNKSGGELVNKTFTNVPYENRNGYVAFFNANLDYDMTNFKFYNVKNAVEPVFEDDFSEDKVTESVTPVAMGNWHINNNNLTKVDYYTCKLAAFDLSKASSSAVNTTVLTKDIKVTNPYEITAQLNFGELKEGLYYGFGFGLKQDAAIDSSGFIGFTKKDATYATAALIKNGTVSDSADISLDDLGVGKRSVDIKFVLRSNNAITVNTGLFSKTFTNILSDGMFAVGSVNTTNATDGNCLLKRITVTENKYDLTENKDISNDFTGTVELDDGEDGPYINNQKYFFGPGVELIDSTSTMLYDPGVSFSDTTDLSCFGYRAKYSEFILEFDVIINKQFAPNSCFGISFGKKTISKSCEGSQTIRFLRDQWNGPDPTLNWFELWNCTDSLDRASSSFEENGYGDFDFYKDTTTKYNMMFVARNRTLGVYFKEDSQPATEMGKCRLLITDVNTTGFVTIYATGNMSIDISNFKLVNIAPNASGDSAVALREHFEGALSDKITVTGGSAQDGKMKLDNGKIELKEEGLYYLTEFTVSNIADKFALDFGGYKLEFAPKQNKATLTCGDFEKTLQSPVGKASISSLNGKTVQVLIQGNRLTVGIRSASDPYDKIYDLIIDETLGAPLTSTKLSLSSTGVLTVDDFKVYSLDGTYAPATVNFADDPNTESPWIPLPESDNGTEPQPDGQGKNKDNNTVLIVVSVVAAAVATGAAVAVLIILQRKKSKGGKPDEKKEGEVK